MIDDEEFRRFFLAQYERLCWLGLLLCGSTAEAEELAQEALVRTFGRWSSSRRPQDPAAYCRRVLVNAYRSRLRRLLVEARHGFQASQPDAYLPDLGEDAMVVWEAARKLPPRQRAVLVLRYHEDLSEAEVARLLRLPLGTVKSLARRGLARLRQELEPRAVRPADAERSPQ